MIRRKVRSDCTPHEVEAVLKRIGACPSLVDPGFEVFIYTVGGAREFVPPALQVVYESRRGCLSGLGGPSDLYRVLDASQVAEALEEVGSLGFGSLLYLPRSAGTLLTAKVLARQMSIPDPSNGSSNIAMMVAEEQGFFEFTTWFDSSPDKSGEEKTYFVLTYASGIPREVWDILEAVKEDDKIG